MKYLGDSFSVGVGSKAYRDNWDRIFNKKDKIKEDEPKEVKEPVQAKKAKIETRSDGIVRVKKTPAGPKSKKKKKK